MTLLALVVAGLLAPNSALAQKTVTKTYKVDGSALFPVSIPVKKGQSVKIKASGTANYCGEQSRCDATPEGSNVGEGCTGGISCGALIGRFSAKDSKFPDGQSPPGTLAIGKGLTLTAPKSGFLGLGIEDWGPRGDNSGAYDVKVTVSAPQTKVEGYVTDRETKAGVPGAKVAIRGARDYQATTDADGYYSAVVREGGYTVRASVEGRESSPKQRSVSVKKGSVATASFKVGPAYKREVVMYTDRGALETPVVGDRVSIDGSDWDPDGGAIEVVEDKKVVARVKAASSFTAKFKVHTFTNNKCRKLIVVRQDGEARSQVVEGVQSQFIAHAVGSPAADGERELSAAFGKKGDYVCHGERVKVRSGDTVLALGLGDPPYPDPKAEAYGGWRVASPSHGIDIYGGLYSYYIRLHFLGWKKAYALPLRHTEDPHKHDTADKPGVVTLENSTYDELLNDGYQRREGNLTVRGAYSSRNGVLYATGNVRIGSAPDLGAGATVALGHLILSGPFKSRQGHLLLNQGIADIRG
jgi:hypothetical protein